MLLNTKHPISTALEKLVGQKIQVEESVEAAPEDSDGSISFSQMTFRLTSVQTDSDTIWLQGERAMYGLRLSAVEDVEISASEIVVIESLRASQRRVTTVVAG